MEPLGFFDFIALEKQAFCVLSDSGTVQEECCLFKVPNVTIRDVTERPETVECGSNMLSGADPAMIRRATKAVLNLDRQWNPPPEYLTPNVTAVVMKIMLGYRN
jgi:UDP-N-acetylglucosamine 2-epimerase (non-hydrolysing)